MSHRVHFLASRVLLIALLATFLSPSLGWQMVASHEQLEHAGASHSGLNQGSGHEEHGDAHGSIGHLLTHMPIDLDTPVLSALMIAGENFEFPVPRFALPNSIPEPPFRPPRPLSLV